MSVEQFLQQLELPVNAEIDEVELAFMEALKERLRTVAEQYNETELQQEDQWLRSFLKQYFDYSVVWVNKQAAKYKDVKEFDNAPAIKKQAKAVVTELQSYITEFVSCYMHINRFMTLLRDEIKEEEIKLARAAAKKIKWTSDSGYVINRHRKEKQQIMARMARMHEARPLLQQIEPHFDAMRSSAMAAFGKDKAEALLRKYNSAMRTSDLTKARRVLKSIGETKKKFGVDQKTATQHISRVLHSGEQIIKQIENNPKLFIGDEDNKILLKPVEVDMAVNADIRELQKIKDFLAKYHMPYMEYKLEALSHLKDKLLVLNTLDSLMGIYKKLLAGIALPLKDIKTVRLYESEILNHTKYLLTGHFTELPKILQRAEETVQEFRESRIELEEFQKMDLSEIDVKQE